MASVETSDVHLDVSDMLACTICLETFTNPKCLPCLHTFCENCIQTYITSGFEKGKTKSFECPVCRGTVEIPKDDCQPEEWAVSLPVNTLISGLLEKQKLANAEQSCMLCQRTKKNTLAKASYVCMECGDTLCETCEMYHSSIKSSSDHTVKSLGEISVKDVSFNILKNNCTDHKGKALALYCFDHETPCCCICVSIGHRKCDKVVTMDDAAKGFSSSEKVMALKEKLARAFDDVTSIIDNQEASLKALESQYKTGFEKVEDVFRSLRKKLDEQEESRKAQLLKKFNEAQDHIETNLVIFKNSKKAIENEQQLLEIATNNSSEAQLMIEMFKLTKQADVFVEKIESNSRNINGFDLVVDDTDISGLNGALEQACPLRCEKTYNQLRFKSFPGPTINFNRFSSVITRAGWNVNSNVDAISFRVSQDVLFHGFLSYGPKNKKECKIEAKLLQDNKAVATCATVITTLHDKTYEDNITKLYLEKPVKIIAGVTYVAAFTITSKDYCDYGQNGMSEVTCDGVKIHFTPSDLSNNGTDVGSGQIPGFIFRKV